MSRIDLLREAISFFKSESWKTIIIEDYQKELDSLRERNDMFIAGGDEEKDYLCGRILEKKYVIKLKEIYEKELDKLILAQKEKRI